jgi:large subunit ribosomal protein L25
MSDMISLKVEPREKNGSKIAARLRKGGKVPAIIYGHKKEPVSISLETHGFLKELHLGHRLFSADLPDGNQALLLKALQYNYLGNDPPILFVLIQRTGGCQGSLNFAVRPGAAHGGILDELLTHLEIECPVVEIPASIPVNVRDLEVGDTINAGQITLPANCVLKTDPRALVINCHEVVEAAVTEEAGAEAPAAPEVITERAAKDEEGAAESKEIKPAQDAGGGIYPALAA